MMKTILDQHPKIVQGFSWPNLGLAQIHGYHAEDWHRVYLFLRSWWRKQGQTRCLDMFCLFSCLAIETIEGQLQNFHYGVLGSGKTRVLLLRDS